MSKWLQVTTTTATMSKIDVERHVIYAKLYAFFCLFILIFHTRNFIFRSLVRSLFFRSIAHSGIQLACIYKIHSHYCSLVIACIVVARFFFHFAYFKRSSWFFFSYWKFPPQNRYDGSETMLTAMYEKSEDTQKKESWSAIRYTFDVLVLFSCARYRDSFCRLIPIYLF